MPHSLDRAIALLTDGRPVDWEGALEDARDSAERRMLEELRGLAELDAAMPPTGVPTVGDVSGVFHGDLANGRRRGDLELLEQIGHGAFGRVFRAWDAQLDREVAVKLFDEEDGSHLAEARRLARITHPNVVSIYGAESSQGQRALWMELLKGRTLDAILREHGPFSHREACAMVLDVCSAVAAVHGAGLVHRDIKAQNIMREPGGRLVLMDLGSSIDVTRSDVGVKSLAGTPLYMAPELFDGGEATVASDIYAIGVLLYRLVTADFPIHAQTVGDVRRAHQTAALRSLRDVRPELPLGFIRIVERCLQRDPRDRFQSAASLERAIHLRDSGSQASGFRVRPAVLLEVLLLATLLIPAAGSRVAARPTVGLRQATIRLWNGFENIALQRAGREEFANAAESYAEALQVLRTELRAESVAVSIGHGKIGWMWHLAHRDSEAAAELQLAALGLQASVGNTHPLRATVLTALTALWQAQGNLAEALKVWREALAVRQRFLQLSAADASTAFDAVGIPEARWADALQHASVAADDDFDGLSNAVELALGTDPNATQSAGAATDGEGDRDADGWPDVMELGLDWDPTAVISHYGNADPLDLGFVMARPFERGAAVMPGSRQPAWRVASDSLGHYTFALPGALKQRALGGFTLTIRSRLIEGGAYVALDLVPFGPRFDVDTYFTTEGKLLIKNNTGLVPHEGPEYPVNGTTAPLTQLRFNPTTGAATWIEGRKRGSGYRGFSSYQENEGLFFGAFNLRNLGTRGVAEYSLVHLVLHGPARSRPPE